MPFFSGPYNYAMVTGPGAGATITSINGQGNRNGAQGNIVPGAFYKVVVKVYVDGTTAAIDDDNFSCHGLGGVGVSGANSPVLACPANGQLQTYEFVAQAPNPVGGGVLWTVSAIAAGTGTAVYHAYIMADQMDPLSDDIVEG
jgi:hypothetical protein